MNGLRIFAFAATALMAAATSATAQASHATDDGFWNRNGGNTLNDGTTHRDRRYE